MRPEGRQAPSGHHLCMARPAERKEPRGGPLGGAGAGGWGQSRSQPGSPGPGSLGLTLPLWGALSPEHVVFGHLLVKKHPLLPQVARHVELRGEEKQKRGQRRASSWSPASPPGGCISLRPAGLLAALSSGGSGQPRRLEVGRRLQEEPWHLQASGVRRAGRAGRGGPPPAGSPAPLWKPSCVGASQPAPLSPSPALGRGARCSELRGTLDPGVGLPRVCEAPERKCFRPSGPCVPAATTQPSFGAGKQRGQNATSGPVPTKLPHGHLLQARGQEWPRTIFNRALWKAPTPWNRSFRGARDSSSR